MEDNDLEKFRKNNVYILPEELVYEMLAEIEEANTDAHWWKCRHDAQERINKEYQKIMKRCSKKLTDDLIKLGRVTNSNAIYVRNALSQKYKIVVKKK